MIKLIAIDLDGTLLDDNKEISQDNKIAIQKAKTYGIKIIIASGRPYFRVKEILQQLDLNHNTDYVITYNGGCILIGDNSEIIYEQRLSNQDICEIINFFHNINNDKNYLAYGGEHISAKKENLLKQIAEKNIPDAILDLIQNAIEQY